MIAVSVPNIKPDQVMTIVRELRAMGWQQGRDFDFAYTSPIYYNNDGGSSGSRPRQTTFSFYTEKYATFFTLKYATERQ